MPRDGRSVRVALFALLLGQSMTAMDVAMVNVSLPSIRQDLNISITAAGWIMIIFFLFTTSFMITLGRLGDVLGRRKVFEAGLIVFIAGSVTSGLSLNYGMLLCGRAVQALGAGMISSNLPALVAAVFPEEERGKALGLAAMTISFGLAVGPFIGGLISGSIGWRYIFFIAPLLVPASLVLCHRYVPESQTAKAESMDVYGAGLIFFCFAPATLALTQGRIWGWSSPAIAGLLIISFAAAWLFLRHERASAFPVIELKLFSNSTFTLSNLAYFACFICLQTVLFTTPFFLQYFLEMTPQAIGAVIGIVNILPLLLLVPSGMLSDRVGTVKLEAAGMAFVCLSLAVLAFAGSSLTLLIVLVSVVLLGLGYGVFCSPNYSAALGSVPEPRRGVAGGVYSTMRNIGSLAGTAMASSVMGQWAASLATAKDTAGSFTSPAFEAAVRHAYLAAFLVALVGLFMVALRFAGREARARRA
jgi:EmrB/QacA subfamily drug resistance transporter